MWLIKFLMFVCPTLSNLIKEVNEALAVTLEALSLKERKRIMKEWGDLIEAVSKLVGE